MKSLPAAHNRRSALDDYPGPSVPVQPSVSIVVPVYNEVAHLDRLAADLLGQSYPAISEIWFVDGQSSDGTFEAIQRLQERDPRVRVLSNPRRLPAAAINMAFERTRSDIVMRADAHARYQPDVVAECVRALLATGAGGVGAIARPAPASTPIGRAIVAAHKSPFGVGVARFRQEGAEGWVDSVWNGCYWRHVADRVGPLREDLWRAEDNDFNERVRAAGYGLYLSPAIRAFYQPRQSLRALWMQYLSNGIGVALALFENRRAFGLRHLAPLALVASLLAPLLAALFWPPALFVAAAVLLLYLGGLLFATLLSARSEPGAHTLLLPAALATLHLSYGCGLLCGFALRLSGARNLRPTRKPVTG
jgi:glycosyltransferase involved in cell wall biosynthesis